jgi:D-alanine-D-alanine ligase
MFKFLARRKVDVVFNLVEFFHGRPEDEMLAASFYELVEIPYTGAPPITLSICQNKPLAKTVLRSYDLPTPRSITIRTMADFKSRHNLHYPLIVKPACEDGSGGIENASIVSSPEALKARVEYVLSDFKMDALVEEYIEGRELNVAVLGNGENRRALPISEITFEDMPESLYKIVSFQAKWDTMHEAYHKTIPSCPADLPADKTEEAQQLALRATEALGTRDYARVDMRMNANGELFILEINPNPNLSEGTGIARSAEAAGIEFKDLLKEIVECALSRSKNRAGNEE